MKVVNPMTGTEPRGLVGTEPDTMEENNLNDAITW
jgi:hypothetical protein